MKVFKAFIQRFEASQRSMNIKKLIIFFSLSGIGTGRVKSECDLICDLFSAFVRLNLVRSSRPEVFCNKAVLKNFTKLKKETLAQVFSFEFCEIFKNTYSYRTHLVVTSA